MTSRRPAWDDPDDVKLFVLACLLTAAGFLMVLVAALNGAPAPTSKRAARTAPAPAALLVLLLHYGGQDWTLTLYQNGDCRAVRGSHVYCGTWRSVGPDLIRVEEGPEGKPVCLTWEARIAGAEAWWAP